MKGGSLRPGEIQDFLQASYEKDAPMNIDGHVLDENYLIYTVKCTSIMNLKKLSSHLGALEWKI